MSGTQHAATRHSPPHVRKSSTLKAARSAPSSKNLSAGPRITIGGGKKGSKVVKEKEDIFDFEDDDDTMPMSFLQYCAMCEKQIIVPNTSILYCSESCRRRDGIPTPPHVSTVFRKTSHPDSTMLECLSASLPDPLPRLRPTPITGIKEASIPPTFHEGASDLDPTEWKPAEPRAADGGHDSPSKAGASTLEMDSGRTSPSHGSSTSLASSWKPKLPHRPSSEAFSYLAQFHRSSDSLTSTKRRSARTNANHTAHATPALSHSLTTSSMGSEESLGGTPYELVMRPRVASRATTAVTTSPTEEHGVEMNYEKKDVPTAINPNLRSASGSLKELLTGAKKTGAAM